MGIEVQGSAPPSRDSSARIQFLWQRMQNNRNVIITSNNKLSKFQWQDFINGDPTWGAYYFLDFMELVNTTKYVVQEKDAGKAILDKIEKWIVRVKYENSRNAGNNPDISLISKGDALWLEFEKVLFSCNLIAVKKTDIASG